MRTFLLILLIIDSIMLIGAILLQSGKGGGLAASFGGVSSSADSLLGTRQAGNLLTRTSWAAGGAFLFFSFVLSLMSGSSRTPKSVLDEAFTQPAPATGPATAPAPGTSVPGVNLTPTTPAPAETPAAPPAGTAPAPKP